MKRAKWSLIAVVLAVFFWILSNLSLEATLKYKKDTGKKCTFCHSSIPEKGDEDPKLNEEGKKFKENKHKLTEEQKKKPDAD